VVEICVKFVKRLIYGSIRNCVLVYSEFELVVMQARQLINSRPIAFKEALRDDAGNIPAPITPELLLYGRELVVCNTIPQTHGESDDEWVPDFHSKESLRKEFEKMRNVRNRMVEIYNEEFLSNLVNQATNSKNRYKNVHHEKLKVGDIILLKENNMKAAHYPKAIVRSVFVNSADEVTDITAMKGCSRELVKRHVSSVLKYMDGESLHASDDNAAEHGEREHEVIPVGPRRGPARACKYVNN